ncbi:hypothetical protein [Pseudovibrio denitrificans]|uniref:hypothetical protein n=1 Tax=Pseudovibrio denitrificans TaxID=258256 RepID=UPI000A5E7406|nr:hypothetical protein [Pseudovibrio denitrificans]
MPAQAPAPKYDDWLKKVYVEMNWKFHDLVGGGRKKRSPSVTSKISEASAAIGSQVDEDTPDWTVDPDIPDYVVAGTPAEERKKRPLTAALSDAASGQQKGSQSGLTPTNLKNPIMRKIRWAQPMPTRRPSNGTVWSKAP